MWEAHFEFRIFWNMLVNIFTGKLEMQNKHSGVRHHEDKDINTDIPPYD